MKKFNILLAGLIFTPLAFAGGYGLTTPVRLQDKPVAKVEVKKVIAPRVITITRVPRYSLCGRYTTSRWYECDTKSVLRDRKFRIRGERISGDLIPTIRNRATRGHDQEREYDRQAAARNKLLRWRRAFSR